MTILSIPSDRRADYFALKADIERKMDQVPDGKMLGELAEAAEELAVAAQMLRHNLPERSDEALERAVREADGYSNRPSRYLILWPDGELYASPYTQRPAALKKFELASRRHPELRIYDRRLRRFLGDEELSGIAQGLARKS